MMEEHYTKRVKTPEKALDSLMTLCAKSEKTVSDAMRLLARWGVEPSDREQVVAKLLQHKFIDEMRYARAYVREKSSLSGWGVHKIRAGLRAKRVAEQVIAEALTEIAENNTLPRLEERLKRKLRSVKAKNGYDLRAKLIRYGMGLGYEYSDVCELVSGLIAVTDDDPGTENDL